MIKKRIIALIISAAVVISSLAVCIVAFGNDISWSYDNSTKTLYINGTTEMDNYTDEYSTPWNSYVGLVEKVVIANGVKSIGAYSFAGMFNLEEVIIPYSVKTIYSNAFASCNNLKNLNLPNSITKIYDMTFAYDSVNVYKKGFVVYVDNGSYSLYYAINNGIDFVTENTTCGEKEVNITAGVMTAYYKFTPKYDGVYTFISDGNYDTIGYLYNSEINLIVSNDDLSNNDTNFKITRQLSAGQTYYIGAKIYGGATIGTFKMNILADSFTYSGVIYAMQSPNGMPSDITVSDAIVNGTQSGDGFTVEIEDEFNTIEIDYNGKTYRNTINPDSDNYFVIMVCDMNSDGYVNAKDYAIMHKINSKYKSLYGNFINYKVN